MRIIFTFLLAILLLSCDKSVLENSNSSDIQNGTGGSLARFTLAGNYLYVIEDASLKTFDVTNPANPILKNSLGIGNNIETIYPYKSNLFIGSQNGMFIYSISNPAAPQYSGSASHVRSCDPVVANDTAAFVTLRGGGFCGAVRDGLYLYNIANLLSPQLINTVDLSTPFGLGLKDSTLFVCRGANGMTVINVKNIRTPVQLQTITGNDFRDVIPYNDLLICYVTDGLALYDISNIANIQFIKKVLN
jgi:hypothetical protein